MSGDHNQYQKPTSKDSLQVEGEEHMRKPIAYIKYRDISFMRTVREAEITRLKELAEYRLKLLTKMLDEKPWVGLTDEEIDEAMDVSPPNLGGEFYYDDVQKIARAIEVKLKEKNAYGWQSVSNPTEYLDELRGGADT
jgi:hypothetical protein